MRLKLSRIKCLSDRAAYTDTMIVTVKSKPREIKMLERDSRATTCDFPHRNRDLIDPLIKYPYADQSLIPPLDRRENRQDRYTKLPRLCVNNSSDSFCIGNCFEIS